jgi:hypothetical protein
LIILLLEKRKFQSGYLISLGFESLCKLSSRCILFRIPITSKIKLPIFLLTISTCFNWPSLNNLLILFQIIFQIVLRNKSFVIWYCEFQRCVGSHLQLLFFKILFDF